MTMFSPLRTLYSFFVASKNQPETAYQKPVDLSYKGKGIVSDTITPFERGRVQFQGSWWPAIAEQEITLTAGEVVQVIGRHNITLIVQAISVIDFFKNKRTTLVKASKN